MGQSAVPGLSDPVISLTGVGVSIGKRLENLSIHSVQVLLFHLPRRYMDRIRRIPIAALKIDQEAF